MKIIPYEEISSATWNNLFEKSEEAWLFHCYEWIDIEKKYWASKNFSFAIERSDGTIIGIHPLYLHEIGLAGFSERLLNSGIHRYTGLALLNGLTPGEISASQKMAMKHIFELAEDYHADRIQLNSHNLAPKNLSSRREEIPFWVSKFNFSLGLHFGPSGFIPVPGMSTCCADQILCLSNADEETLFGNFEESCRRAVRKAIKNKLMAVWEENGSVIQNYYQLAETSAKRTGESLPPIGYYEAIHKYFASADKCKLLFARHDGQLAGALFLMLDKNSVNFLAGVSDPKFLTMRVNDFMHWSAIRWAHKNGFSFYRFGPVFPELPIDWPISKVSRFKKKFGGANIPIIQGSFFCKPEKYLEMGKKQIAKLCRPASRCAKGRDLDDNNVKIGKHETVNWKKARRTLSAKLWKTIRLIKPSG